MAFGDKAFLKQLNLIEAKQEKMSRLQPKGVEEHIYQNDLNSLDRNSFINKYGSGADLDYQINEYHRKNKADDELHEMLRNDGVIGDLATGASIALGDNLPKLGYGLGFLLSETGTEANEKFYQGIKTQEEEAAETRKKYSTATQLDVEAQQAEAALRNARFDELEDPSVMDYLSDFSGAVGEHFRNPGSIVPLVGENTDSIVTMPLGGLAVSTAAKAGAKQLIKKGTSEAVKKKVATRAGQKAAEKAGLAYTGISEGGHNAIGTVEEIESMSHEELAQSPQYVSMLLKNPDKTPNEIRRILAQDAGRKTGLVSGGTAAVIGKLTGASDFMSRALTGTKAASKTTKKVGEKVGKELDKLGKTGKAVKTVGKSSRKIAEGALKEGVEEVLQSGSGQAISNLAVSKVDPNKKIMEGVAEAAASGLIAGTATGGAVGTVSTVVTDSGKGIKKSAQKAVQARREAAAKATEKSPTKKWETIQDKDISKEITKAIQTKNNEELVNAYITLSERIPNEKNPKTKANYEKQKSLIESLVKPKEPSEKVKTTPVEELNDSEIAEGVSAVVANPTAPYSADLNQKLSGSKKLTPNQKVLLQESSNPQSTLNKVLNKNMEEVSEEILYGGDGFTGLKEYQEAITTAIQSNDINTTIRALNRLEKFKQSHSKKANTGKSHQNKDLNETLLAQVKDESLAIGIVYNGLYDTAENAFPKFKELKKNHKKKMSEVVSGEDVSVSPVKSKTNTVPQQKRIEIVGEALNSLLHPNTKSVNSNVSNFRKALATKAGLGNKALPELRATYSQYESLVKKGKKLNQEEKALKRELRNKILKGYDALTSNEVGGNFQQVLKDQAGEKDISSLFGSETVELNTGTKQRGHTPEPRIKTDTDEKRSHYETLHEFVSGARRALTTEQVKVFENLPERFNEFSESIIDDYNTLVNIINEAELHNSEVNIVEDDKRTNPTAPDNRVFLNSLERLPLNSLVRKSFKYIDKFKGLLHLENNLFDKFLTEGDIKEHLTANMSEVTKNDAVRLSKFVTGVTKALNKSFVFENERDDINNVFKDFVDSEGTLDSSVANAVGVGLADWFHTSGMKTILQNTDEMIAHNLGMSGEAARMYKPTANESIELRNAGVNRNNFIVSVGKNIYKNLGYRLDEDAEIHLEETMINNLGTLALIAAERYGNKGLIKTQYIHRFTEETFFGTQRTVVLSDSSKFGDVPPPKKGMKREGSTTPVVKAVSRLDADKKEILLAASENAATAMNNYHLKNDILGIQSSFQPVYMSGDRMPKSEDYQPYASPDEHTATNNQNSIEHVLNTELFDIVMAMTPEQQIAVMDDLPDPGMEHQDNTKRLEDIRNSLLEDYAGARRVKERMDSEESPFVRFKNIIAKTNRRMNQAGTDGNPVSSKLFRELFIPKEQGSTIDPSNKEHDFAFKLAVLHGIDGKTNVLDDEGNPVEVKKGIDKSTNLAVENAWNNLLKDEVMMDAATTMEPNKLVAILNRKKIKQGNGGDSGMHKIHALYALNQYLKAEGKPFHILLGKEDDGIVNGTANLRMQAIGTPDIDSWFNEVAKVGIYKNELDAPSSFPEFTRQDGNLDPYEALAKIMTEVLNDTTDLPEVSGSKSLFRRPSKLLAKKDKSRAYWSKNKKDYVIKQTANEYKQMTNAVNFLLNYTPEADLMNEFLEIGRSFTKDPLMQHNYQAGLKSLKIALGNKIEESIRVGLEQINRIEDSESREAAIYIFEQGIADLSFMAPENDYKFEVNKENPLKTVVSYNVRDMINVAVEFTYGPAMEVAFEKNYSGLKDNTNHLVNITRLATKIYTMMFDKLETEFLKDSDQISLTFKQKKEIEDKLKKHSPAIAHALSKNRLEDGVTVGEKEALPNKDDQGKALNPDANVVKHTYKNRNGKVTTIRSITHSRRMVDPGVSAAGVLTQAIDGAIQKVSMARGDSFTNVHDAKILNIIDSLKMTQQTNKDFADIHQNYSFIESSIEMLRDMLKSEDATSDILDLAFEEIAVMNASLRDIPDAETYLQLLEEFNEDIQEQRKEAFASGMVVNQYHNSDESGHVIPKTEYKKAKSKVKPEPIKEVKYRIEVRNRGNINVSKNLKWDMDIAKFVNSITSKTSMGNVINVISYEDANHIAFRRPKSELAKAVKQGYKGGYYVLEGKNTVYIVMEQTKRKAPFFTVLAHELGHIFFYEKAKDLANSEEQALLREEFNEVADQYKDRNKPFEEWMADKFAGWVISSTDESIHKPFFKRLQGLLKDFFDKAVSALPKGMTVRIRPSIVYNLFVQKIIDRDKFNKKQETKESKLLYKIEQNVDKSKQAEYKNIIKNLYLKDNLTTEESNQLLDVLDEIAPINFSSPITDEQYILDEASAIERDLKFDGSTAMEVFESLDNYRQSSVEHKDHLKRMVNIISPAVERIRMLVRTENINESYGSEQGGLLDIRVNTGAKANNLEMSAQELYVHETFHAFFRQIDAKKSPAWKKLKSEYLRAKKYLKVEDFLVGINNPTDADRKAAEKLRDHALFNSTLGSVSYQTSLGEAQSVPNADPVEEFAVLGATNEQVRRALKNLDTRLKGENNPHTGILKRLIDAFHQIIRYFTDHIYSLRGIDGDERVVKLVEYLVGAHQAPLGTLHRVLTGTDNKVDAIGEWAKNKLSDTNTVKGFKIAGDRLGKPVVENIRQWITDTSIGQNKLLVSIANEFTLGRMGLASLTKLLTKSSYFIEKKSQQVIEYVASEVIDLLPGITDEESSKIYSAVLETDAQSLLDHHNIDTIHGLMVTKSKRIKRINELTQKVFNLNPRFGRFMKYHAEDLGYYIATGERLLADGMYTNASQIANLWGFEKKLRSVKNVDALIPVLDEIATLSAIGYSKNIRGLFSEDKFTKNALHNLLLLHKETVEISAKEAFENNKYNMKKGYVREKLQNDLQVVTGTSAEHDQLIANGYTRSHELTQDPSMRHVGKRWYYTKQGGQQTYLTGVLSTANTKAKGVNIFTPVEAMNEMDSLKLVQDFEYMVKVKKGQMKKTFAARQGMPKLKPKNRGSIAQPLFDSEGEITGYRMILPHSVKDDMLHRETDIRKAIGYTLAGISRKKNSKLINRELMDNLFSTYEEDYKKYPNEFIEISPKSEKDTYYLIPEDARNYGKKLFESDTFLVRREQVDIAFGYRKFSVSQLRHDSHPASTLMREALRLANNTAELLFNNTVGISFEKYYQSFVATAKDTLIIKSGVVTAANITSNVLLLWWSGVNLKDAIADHAIAYKATFEYNRDTKELFKLNRKLVDPNTDDKDKKKIDAEIAVLKQDIYNNPVRELIEAGLYQTIVDDVETSENVSEAKNKLDELLEPINKITPKTIKDAGKFVLMTHDTKIYQVFRDVAQISDFAARYSLHKHNMKSDMSFEDSVRDVKNTFVEYDIPQHKSMQYLNDMGVMGFTKWLFRMQQVFVKRFGEKPARAMILILLQNMFSAIENPVNGVITGFDAIANRFGIDWWSAMQRGAVVSALR